MNEETRETQVPLWEESHPWLFRGTPEEDDSVVEVIRYTLDEIRFA